MDRDAEPQFSHIRGQLPPTATSPHCAPTWPVLAELTRDTLESVPSLWELTWLQGTVLWDTFPIGVA